MDLRRLLRTAPAREVANYPPLECFTTTDLYALRVSAKAARVLTRIDRLVGGGEVCRVLIGAVFLGLRFTQHCTVQIKNPSLFFLFSLSFISIRVDYSTNFAGSRVFMQSASSPRLSSHPSTQTHDRAIAASGRPTSVIWSQLSKPTTGSVSPSQGRVRTGLEHMKDRTSSPATVSLEDGLLYSKERKVTLSRVHLDFYLPRGV